MIAHLNVQRLHVAAWCCWCSYICHVEVPSIVVTSDADESPCTLDCPLLLLTTRRVAAADLLGLGPALSLPLAGLELTEDDGEAMAQVLFSPLARLHVPALGGEDGMDWAGGAAAYEGGPEDVPRPAQLFVQFEDVGWLAWAPALHRAVAVFGSS